MRRFPALRALLLASVLGVGLLSAPAGSPAPVAGVGPLPDCRLDDILTEPRGYDDWSITLVDWILTLGPGYRPRDLVPVGEGNVAAPNGGHIRAIALEDLQAMAAAAEKNGTPIVAYSPFRGYRQQVALFHGYAGANGSNFENAITYSARPGHSEHQLGVTIDFIAPGEDGLRRDWEETRTGAWMAANAWKYGWLMSYPKGKQDVTCYMYEPWHYRYVGRDLAKKIHESGLTIREYLWANFTQIDPDCVALPAPTVNTRRSPAPSPRSCAIALPSPTIVPSEPPASASPGVSVGPATAPASLGAPSHAPSPPPTSGTGTILGLEPGLALLLLVAALGGVGLVLARGALRR